MQPQTFVLNRTSETQPDNSAESYLKRGMWLHQSGAFAAAEKEYRRALKRAPERADILHLTGLAVHQSGRNMEAVKLIRRAIKRAPREVSYRVNQAIVLNALGRWREAKDSCRAALKLEPSHSEAWNNLGRALAGLGEGNAAEEAYRAAIAADAGNAAAHNNLGLLHIQSGAADLAAEHFRNAICINPRFTTALTNLASVYLHTGLFKEAEKACNQALAVAPDLVPALHSLGTVKSAQGRHREAEALFEKVLALEPGHDLARVNLGSVKSAAGNHAEAEAQFRDTLGADPNSSEAHLNLGFCLADQGRLNEAIQCFRRTLALDPANIEAYYAIATSNQVKFDETDRTNLDALALGGYPGVGLNMDQQVKLQFVLAAVAFADGDRKLGFHYCRQGNEIRKIMFDTGGQDFDADHHDRQIEAVAQTFNQEFFEARAGWGAPDARPIFIVGMPRSGTTLVERIIDAHHMVQGLGETDDIAKLVQRAAYLGGDKDEFFAGVSELGQEQISALAHTYVRDVSQQAPAGVMLADKMPFNFINLGFIALLFPCARIIHCSRDPRDIGLSCYLTNFVQPHSWSCDLAQIGRYIRAHDRLIEHWRSTLPVEIFDWNYENAVAGTEAEARRLVEFLGLPWDSACLDFHVGAGAVQSASKWQVRQPIYKSSAGRWQNFADNLLPLFAAISCEP